MSLQQEPVVRQQMLVRRPVGEVFRAFVDPAVTMKFWFTGSSGQLVPGATVTWSWDMYGFSTPVKVIALDPDRRILIDWGDPPSTVEWTFRNNFV